LLDELMTIEAAAWGLTGATILLAGFHAVRGQTLFRVAYCAVRKDPSGGVSKCWGDSAFHMRVELDGSDRRSP
jgi:hypothetical protein